MKKKRFGLLLLALVLCLCMSSLSGCTPDVYEQYVQAAAKTNALGQMDADVNMEMSMGIAGSTFQTTVSGTMKADHSGGSPVMDMALNMALLGQSIDMHVYYADGVAYYDAQGTKYKMALPIDQLKEQTDQVSTQILQFDESAILKSMATSEKEGSRYRVTVSADAIQSYLKDAMGSTMQNSDSSSLVDLNSMNLQFSDVDVSFLIGKDGYIHEQTLQFTCTADMDAMSSGVMTGEMEMTYDATVTYNNPGQPVTITAPNLNEYPAYEDLASDATLS